jgi:hypothetical protein
MSENLEAFLSSQDTAPEAPAQGESTQLALEADAPESLPSAEPQDDVSRRADAIWREEREKRKELQRQVEQMNARWEQMVSRMQAPPTIPEAPSPDEEIPAFEDDPIGHLRAKNAVLEKQLGDVLTKQNQQTQAGQQAAQFQNFRTQVDTLETAFSKDHPDYGEAVNYLYSAVGNMAKAMGYPPEQVQQIISQTASDIAVRAMHAQRNPAEMAYEAAKQMGWTAASAEDGAASMQRPPTSLASVAGKRTNSGGTPSWDVISKMDDKEFDSFWTNFAKNAR